MKKHYILNIIIISIIIACSTKTYFEGQIQDDNGKAVNDAEILIGNTKKTVMSDSSGKFSAKIPVGETTLKIQKLGYFPLFDTVTCVEDQKNNRMLTMHSLNKDIVYHETDSLMVELMKYETIYKRDQFWGMVGSNVTMPFSVHVDLDIVKRFKPEVRQSFLSSDQIAIIKVSNPDDNNMVRLGSLTNYVTWRNSKMSFKGVYASECISVKEYYRCELINPEPGFYAVSKLGGSMNAAGYFTDTYPHLFGDVYLFMVE